MSAPDWCRWYPGKWITGTLTLTNEQRGFYVQVISAIMDTGECSSDPKFLGRLCNCRSHCARRLRDELIALGKLTESGAKLHQNRAETELKRARNFSERGRFAALTRWENNGLADAPAANLAPENKTQNKNKKDSPPLTPPPTPKPEPARPSERANGTRIGDWRPSESDLDFARRQGVPGHDLPEVEAEFVDYWCAVPGQRGRKLNWPGTWRNHIRLHVVPRYRNRTNVNGFPAPGRGPPARRPLKGEYADVVGRLDVCDPDPAAYIAAKNKARAQ